MFFRYAFQLIAIILLAPMPAIATDLSFIPNAQEMLLLPPYCQVKFAESTDSPEWKMWSDRLAPNFGDIHHYCVALNNVNRYWGARSALDRGYYLKVAMDNFDYMVKAAKPGFPLLSELYSNRGDVFKLQGQPGQAMLDYDQAIKSNPHLVRPYFQLIDLYQSEKKHNKSLEVATDGLRNNPDSKAMQRRYLELGGKRPFPKPVQTEAAKTDPDAKSENDAVAAPVDTPPEPAPKIGSPTNPYCRFCP